MVVGLRNIQDLLSDGKTPHERRIGMSFNGTVVPFDGKHWREKLSLLAPFARKQL